MSLTPIERIDEIKVDILGVACSFGHVKIDRESSIKLCDNIVDNLTALKSELKQSVESGKSLTLVNEYQSDFVKYKEKLSEEDYLNIREYFLNIGAVVFMETYSYKMLEKSNKVELPWDCYNCIETVYSKEKCKLSKSQSNEELAEKIHNYYDEVHCLYTKHDGHEFEDIKEVISLLDKNIAPKGIDISAVIDKVKEVAFGVGNGASWKIAVSTTDLMQILEDENG